MLKAEGVLTRNSGETRSPRSDGDSTVRRGLELSPLRGTQDRNKKRHKGQGVSWFTTGSLWILKFCYLIAEHPRGGSTEPERLGRNQKTKVSILEIFYKM